MNNLRTLDSWQNLSPPPSKEQIAAVEFVAKAPVPSAYKQFLLTIHGDRPKERHYFKYGNPAQWMQLWDFACLDDGLNDLTTLVRWARPSCVPMNGFPIATTIWENFVFIGLDPPHKDTVFLWHQDFAEELKENPFMFPLADDFWQFLDSLTVQNQEIMDALGLDDDQPEY